MFKGLGVERVSASVSIKGHLGKRIAILEYVGIYLILLI